MSDDDEEIKASSSNAQSRKREMSEPLVVLSVDGEEKRCEGRRKRLMGRCCSYVSVFLPFASQVFRRQA